VTSCRFCATSPASAQREGNYLLLYEYDGANDAVELIAVVDGRRDLGALF
jgi:hypothetical protein